MSSNLHFLVSRAKVRDKAAAMILLDRFLPQIKNISHAINGEDTYQDLQLFLLELADKIPLERDVFQNERILGAYIANSIRRRSCFLQCKKNRKENNELTLDENLEMASPSRFENSILLLSLLETLTSKERLLIYLIYFYGYNCAEIARMRHISTQSVNQAKHKILKKLHKACTL